MIALLISLPSSIAQPSNTFISNISLSLPARKLTRRSRRPNKLRQKLLKRTSIPQLSPNFPIPQPPTIYTEEETEKPNYKEEEMEVVSASRDEEDPNSHELECSIVQLPNRAVPEEADFLRYGLKLGLGFVGFLVLHAVYVFWVYGSVSFDGEMGFEGEKSAGFSLRERIMGLYYVKKKKKKKDFDDLIGGGFVKKDEFGQSFGINNKELEEKIIAIRAMAREARVRERMQKGVGSEELVGKTFSEEVNERMDGLSKLVQVGLKKVVYEYESKTDDTRDGESNSKTVTKEVDKCRGELSSIVEISRNLGEEDQRSENKSVTRGETNGNLEELSQQQVHNVHSCEKISAKVSSSSFREKSVKAKRPKGFNKPKGFKGISKSDVNKKKEFVKSSSGKGKHKDTQTNNNSGVCSSTDTSSVLITEYSRNNVIGSGNGSDTQRANEFPETSEISHDTVGINCSKSESNVAGIEGELENERTRGATPTKSDGQVLLNSASNSTMRLQTREAEKRSTHGKLEDNVLKESDLWWMKLPYVLVIFLHMRAGTKSSRGLYSLKRRDDPDDDGTVRTIAFENLNDANNFAFLLESFFEDLGDTSADVVSLSVQELHGKVKSGKMKPIVVRKGQLQLYAGQQLEEAERQLRSIQSRESSMDE